MVQVDRKIPWFNEQDTIRIWRADAAKSYCQSFSMPLDDKGWYGNIAQSERLFFVDIVQDGMQTFPQSHENYKPMN